MTFGIPKCVFKHLFHRGNFSRAQRIFFESFRMWWASELLGPENAYGRWFNCNAAFKCSIRMHFFVINQFHFNSINFCDIPIKKNDTENDDGTWSIHQVSKWFRIKSSFTFGKDHKIQYEISSVFLNHERKRMYNRLTSEFKETKHFKSLTFLQKKQEKMSTSIDA